MLKGIKIKTTVSFMFMMLFAFAVSAQEKTAAGLYNEGLAFLKEKNYESGLPLMEQALAKAETDQNEKVIKLAKKNGAVAAYNVGNTKRKAGDHDGAMAMYEKGIMLNPDNASNYSGKAAVLEAKGNKVESVSAYLVAAEKQVAAGKADRAEKIVKKAQNTVGRMYTGKDYDNAIAAGKAFIAMKPNSEVNYYVARSLTEQGKNDEALPFSEQAITLAGETADDKYYVAKAVILENLNKPTEAIEMYKKVTGEKYKKQAEYKIQTLGSK